MAVSRFMKTFFIGPGLLLIFSSALAAEGIKPDLETAVKLALEQNLELKAKREELGIAEGRLIRANLFLQSNPELESEVGNFRVTQGEPEFGKSQTNYGFSLSQEFEIGGQPTYRRQAAQRNIEKAKLGIGDLERILRFRITEIFLKLLNLQAKVRQAEQVVSLRSRLYEASKTRLALGDIPEVQLILSEFELNKAKSDLISFQREYEELLSRLKSELALEKDQGLELIGEPSRPPLRASLDELLKTALEERPDLAAFDQERKIAEAEGLLTRADRVPNIKLGAFYNREKQEGGFIAGGRLSIALPFFDRKQAELREALARKRIAHIHYLDAHQSIEKAVRGAYEKFRLSERDLSLYPEGAMKRFDESMELYQRAYQERQIDLSEAILFLNQVIEARLKFIDTLTNYSLSLAELKLQAGIE